MDRDGNPVQNRDPQQQERLVPVELSEDEDFALHLDNTDGPVHAALVHARGMAGEQTALLSMDNQVGLIFLYVVYGLAFNIFVYVGYMQSIPKDLEEAALVDGASIWSTWQFSSASWEPRAARRAVKGT